MNHTPENIQSLAPNEVFVFGSNEAGEHAGGAARLAYNKFGAEWGKGIGHHGQTFAIPTMDSDYNTLKLAHIKSYVLLFRAFVHAHPELHFLVTKIGCGIAGYGTDEIAPLFEGMRGLPNVSLPKEFTT